MPLTILLGENSTGKSKYMRNFIYASMTDKNDILHVATTRQKDTFIESEDIAAFASNYFHTDFFGKCSGSETLLPVIEAAYLAKTSESTGFILAIEHPELCLHPRNAYRVSKMLVDCVTDDVHVIIETHSEAILSYVSEMIEKGELKTSEVSIMMFHRDLPTTQHSFNLKGIINDWPIGFLCE